MFLLHKILNQPKFDIMKYKLKWEDKALIKVILFMICNTLFYVLVQLDDFLLKSIGVLGISVSAVIVIYVLSGGGNAG
jgi:hypothetical protein